METTGPQTDPGADWSEAQSSLFSLPQCPTAPDVPTWRFGWQTVHGPIGAVWTSAGRIAKVEHVYEFRRGWGIIIPSATRRNCTRVWFVNEDATDPTLITEVVGQPTSLDVFALEAPDEISLTVRKKDIEYVEYVREKDVVLSLERGTETGRSARLIPSPDRQRLLYVRVVDLPSGPPASRVELTWYDRDDGLLVATSSFYFAGAEPWVAFDHAGHANVSDGQTAARFELDGTFTPIAVPTCNPRAATISGPVDAQGRTIFWTGEAVVISAPQTEPPFGCW